MRILVVEDNDVNTIVVLGYLDKLGFTADVAVNGLEAVEATIRQGRIVAIPK